MNDLRPKAILLTLLGLAFCTLPAMAAVLFYFPIWVDRGGAAALSGFTLFLMLLAISPMLKAIRHILRSPASHTMWFIAFVVFFALSSIAEEMTVICFVGFVSNLIGALFFKWARRYGKGDKKDEGQV